MGNWEMTANLVPLRKMLGWLTREELGDIEPVSGLESTS